MATNTADFVSAFTATVTAYVQGGATLADVQSAYRPIPAAARGAASAAAMTAAIGSGANMAHISDINDALLNLPTATNRVKVDITDEMRQSARTAAFRAVTGNLSLLDVIGLQWLETDKWDALVASAQKAFNGLNVDGRTRTDMNRNLLDIVDEGDVLHGSGKHDKVTATVNADGTVTSGNVTGSVSKVAVSVTGHKAVNGWRFWTFQGKRLADC